MRIDVSLTGSVAGTKARAAAAEVSGYDGVWCHETNGDPFLQSLQVGDATSSVAVGTSVAIAFARSPMTVAYTAYDLARYTGGRFVLGLGSQIKAHVQRRFGMPWSQPADRMREFILALRSIWHCWEHSEALDVRGHFYQHTLMPPGFTPEVHDSGPPAVYLAGVGERMTAVAGEVADGYFFHPFTTPRYLAEVTMPALDAGRKASELGADGPFSVCGPVFVACSRDERQHIAAVEATRRQIAFYASTPAYRGVLDLHGMGDLQPELTALTKAGRWSEMERLVDDDLLGLMAVVGTPDDVGRELVRRYGAMVDRVVLYAVYPHDPADWGDLLVAARAPQH